MQSLNTVFNGVSSASSKEMEENLKCTTLFRKPQVKFEDANTACQHNKWKMEQTVAKIWSKTSLQKIIDREWAWNSLLASGQANTTTCFSFVITWAPALKNIKK